MSERNQLQYQPVTGPVWTEPVASRLAWLPRVQQPGRSLPPNRLGDYVRPEFAALYKPERLEWVPAERYFGRIPARAAVDYSVLIQLVTQVYDPQTLGWLPSDRYYGRAIPASPKLFQGFALVGPSAFDPRQLDWMPRGQQPALGLPPNRLGDFVRPEFQALYKSENLEWTPSDRYASRPLARAAVDYSVLVQLVTAAAFDPQTLDWMPRGTAPQVPLERRRAGDFQQPSFSALYDPRRLEWTPSDRYAGRALPRALNDQSVLVQLVVTAVFDPQNLDWQPRDRYIGRSPARALVDWSVLQGEPIVAPPIPPAVIEDQPSNWQADYWKHKHKTKKERERETLEERIRLGILPAEFAEEAQSAVAEAVQASIDATRGAAVPGVSLLAAIEAREKYDNAYKKAYKAAYIGTVVAELWKRDVKREQRRRAVAFLLLH